MRSLAATDDFVSGKRGQAHTLRELLLLEALLLTTPSRLKLRLGEDVLIPPKPGDDSRADVARGWRRMRPKHGGAC